MSDGRSAVLPDGPAAREAGASCRVIRFAVVANDVCADHWEGCAKRLHTTKWSLPAQGALQAVCDDRPVDSLRLIHRFAVGEVGYEDEVAGWTGDGGELDGHPGWEEGVLFAVDDEDGDGAGGKGVDGAPDVGHAIDEKAGAFEVAILWVECAAAAPRSRRGFACSIASNHGRRV